MQKMVEKMVCLVYLNVTVVYVGTKPRYTSEVKHTMQDAKLNFYRKSPSILEAVPHFTEKQPQNKSPYFPIIAGAKIVDLDIVPV